MAEHGGQFWQVAQAALLKNKKKCLKKWGSLGSAVTSNNSSMVVFDRFTLEADHQDGVRQKWLQAEHRTRRPAADGLAPDGN